MNFAKILAIVALVFICTVAFLAKADNEVYTKLHYGIVHHEKPGEPDYKERPSHSHLIGVAVGKQLLDDLNVEFAVYHNRFNIKEFDRYTLFTQKIETNSAFINLNYDLYTLDKTTHYIVAGIGVSHNNAGTYKATGRLNGLRPTNPKTAMAFTAGTGIKTFISDKVDLDIGYRYFDLGRAKTSNIGIEGALGTISTPVLAKLKRHVVLIGFNYYF